MIKTPCAVTYECVSCGGSFTAPLAAFTGFIRAVRIATKMGSEISEGERVINTDKIPAVKACCPDCFQHFL